MKIDKYHCQFSKNLEVTVVEHFGCEDSIVNAARVSRGVDIDHIFNKDKDDSLLATLFKNKHGTPFEFAGITYFIRVPLFIRSQLERYRHCSFVEKSFRACEPTEYDLWVPDLEDGRISEEARDQIVEMNESALEKYYSLRESKVPKELARLSLPQTLITEFVMTTNVRELLHIFDERLKPDAQYETRCVVKVMFDHFEYFFPTVAKLFKINVKP